MLSHPLRIQVLLIQVATVEKGVQPFSVSQSRHFGRAASLLKTSQDQAGIALVALAGVGHVFIRAALLLQAFCMPAAAARVFFTACAELAFQRQELARKSSSIFGVIDQFHSQLVRFGAVCQAGGNHLAKQCLGAQFQPAARASIILIAHGVDPLHG